MSNLQARLDAAKNDVLSKLSQKSAELDSIKDVIARTAESEEEATAKLTELSRRGSYC